MAGKYTVGEQPCQNYDPAKDGPFLMDNVHECFGPYDGRPKGCAGTVSFCKSCSRDHHSGGYNTCGKQECEHEWRPISKPENGWNCTKCGELY